jgi:group I intron endonuclease
MQVYAIQNEANGKLYIGQHARENLTAYLRRQVQAALASRGNKTSLYRAIRKYGGAAFNIRCIHKAHDKADLDCAEIAYMKLFGTQNDYLGYNITAGGGGRLGTKNPPHTQAFKDALRDRVKGVPKTAEHRQAIGDAQRGRKFTKEHRAALREGQLGKKKLRTAEHSQKIRENKLKWWAAKKGTQ